MPKPMTKSIEVEEIAFGRVFRMLDATKGVVAIHLRGSGPKTAAAPKSESSKRGGGATTECLVLAALVAAGKLPLNKVSLVAAIRAGGKSDSSLPDTLNKLNKKRHIVSTGKSPGGGDNEIGRAHV